MHDDDQSTTPMPTKDYYYLLGVRPDATGAEIQEAYSQLYDKFGPHVHIDNMEQESITKTYREINAAYEILMDPERRKDYDKRSKDTRQSFSDLRALWTKHATKYGDDQAKVQAQALEVEVEVTLKEAIKGCKKELEINDAKTCEDCAGKKPMSRRQCPNCRGLGYFNVERRQEIDLPAGLYDNMEIRFNELGRFDVRAGKYGDLIVKIHLAAHPVLKVLGRDITLNVPVTLYEAMLGAEIEVPSATGKVVMKIQPLTQPGRVYRLKGLGLAGADQLATIDVVIPRELSAQEVTLYRKLKELSKEPNPRENMFG